jgi:hypothetical protein
MRYISSQELITSYRHKTLMTCSRAPLWRDHRGLSYAIQASPQRTNVVPAYISDCPSELPRNNPHGLLRVFVERE